MTENGRRLVEAAKALGRDQTFRVLAGECARAVGLGLLGFAALLVLDRVLPDPAVSRTAFLPSLVRTLGFALAILGPLGLLARALVRRLPAIRDVQEAARRTEEEAGVLRERLVPALQVLETRGDPRTGYSTDLVDQFVDETAEAVGRVRPRELPYNERLRHGRIWLVGGAVAALLVGFVLGPGRTGEGLTRLAGAASWLGPRPPASFVIDPGDTSVPRGEDVRLAARVDHVSFRGGRAVATLEWRSDENAAWREVELEGADHTVTGADGARIPSADFAHVLESVRETFRYRFRHGAAFSAEHEVRAMPRPSLAIEEVRYRYPDYTGLPERVVQDGAGDLAAVRGTVARVVARSTNPPAEGRLVYGDGRELDLERSGDRLAVEVPLDDNGTYRLHVVDELGLTNPNPLEYRIRALADEAPFIRLLEPGEDRDLDESMRVDLRFSAVDDYGLGSVSLVYEIDRREGDELREPLYEPNLGTRELTHSTTWDLSSMDLLPGDTVTYRLEVVDNCASEEGPHSARTRSYVLRFPTLGEIFAEIDEREQASIDDLKELAKDAERVEEKIEEISREILKQGESSWENRQEVERALESQQQLAEEMRRVQEDIEANLDQLAESEFMTNEAMQKMEQIQKLMEEVASTEMKEALEKLREAMQETNPRHMQEDLAEFQQTQEELMKQLDRVMENLKQFRLEEKMKAAVREMEELAARQERVNDELAQLDEPKDEKAAGEDETGEDEAAGEDETEGEEASGEEGDEQSESSEGEEGKDGEKSDASEGEELAQESDESQESQESDESQESEGEESGESSEKSQKEPGEMADAGEKPEPQESESGEKQDPGEEGETDEQREMDRLAQQERALSEEAERLQEELKELAKMVEELRDAQDSKSMQELSEQMNESGIPEKMDEMAESMESGDQQEAQEQGEKALTELREMLTQLQAGAQSMQARQMAINQAAINRAVRDLLSLSDDEELLAGNLSNLPRNSTSATRVYADEQFLLIDGAERVEEMLHEVAKDTPLMESEVGRKLDTGLESMRDAAYGLENGAVQMARDDGEGAVDDLNAVVIALLKTMQTMSQCSTGQPMPGAMQQLQELSQDQQQLNDALQKLRQEGGKSLDQRLRAQMDRLAQEQQRIQEQLQQLLEEQGDGQGTLGRLDDVSRKLEEVADRLARGELDEELLREQDWALTRLLDSQRSMRERDFGRERQSETGEELADLMSPDALPEGLMELDRDLREDLLKALDRRYPPKYEELIKQYFRSLSREEPVPELP